MARKRNRSKGHPAGEPGQNRAQRRKAKRGRNWPSLIFIGLLVLAAATIAVASMLDTDSPDCPPGLVWSDAHGHCH